MGLNRRYGGLAVFSPYTSFDNHRWYAGTIDGMRSIIGYIKKSNQQYVLISGTHMVCNMSFEEAFIFHKEKEADITIIYKEEDSIQKDNLKKYVLIDVNEEERVYDMEVYPQVPKSNKICMKMYIMDKNLLEYLIEEAAARGYTDFIRHILLKNINNLKIYGYKYKGFLARVDCIPAYYKYNMMLLKPEIRQELFYSAGKIYTKIKDEVPAKYTETAVVKNCLVADGCVIEGNIENCVIFRGCRIRKEARVSNRIIMENSEIEENATLDRVILDRHVVVRRGRTLIGQDNYPVVIEKGEII